MGVSCRANLKPWFMDFSKNEGKSHKLAQIGRKNDSLNNIFLSSSSKSRGHRKVEASRNISNLLASFSF